MKRFMNWLTNSFTPTMNKFSQKPVVAALSSSMQKIIPFILTGSCIHLYNVLRSTIPALPNFIRIINFSFGMLGLLTAFMVANQMMEKLRTYQIYDQCRINRDFRIHHVYQAGDRRQRHV